MPDLDPVSALAEQIIRHLSPKEFTNLSTQGSVTIQPSQQVAYRSKQVILNQGFEVQVGADFNVLYGGCD